MRQSLAYLSTRLSTVERTDPTPGGRAGVSTGECM